MPAEFSSVSYTPVELVAGNPHLLVASSITLLAGQSYAAGAVLGEITSGDDAGKYTLSLSAAEDGSQTPDLILADAVDATSADAAGVAYSRGDFNTSALTLGTGHTVSSIREGLRTKGITLISVASA